MPMRATPMLLSPATSICNTVPGLGATLVLIPKTAWEFVGFGGLLEIGITTGRYTSPQDIKIRLSTSIAANEPTRRRLIGTQRENASAMSEPSMIADVGIVRTRRATGVMST